MNKKIILWTLLAASFIAVANSQRGNRTVLEEITYVKTYEVTDNDGTKGTSKCSQLVSKPIISNNDSLKNGLDKLVETELKESGCDSAAEFAFPGIDMDSNLYFKVPEKNSIFATVDVLNQGYLGGAHPFVYETSKIIDLKSGEIVSQDSLFVKETLDKAKQSIAELYSLGAQAQNNKHIGRLKAKSIKLQAQLSQAKTDTEKKKIEEIIRGLTDDIDTAEMCNDVYSDNSSYFNLSPQGAGFLVNVSVPHVVAVCDRKVYIKYKLLADFIAPDSVIGHLIKK